MTKYLNKSFAVPYGSAAYRDNWDKTFGGTMKRPYPTLHPSYLSHFGSLIEIQMGGAVAEHNEAIIELIKKMRDDDLYHVEIYDKIIKAIEPEVP